MKHTKGPWEVGQDYCEKTLSKGHYYIHASTGRPGPWDSGLDDVRVATAYTHDKENARLIAAAPDLLDACRFVLNHLRPEGWDGEQTVLFDGCLHPDADGCDDHRTVVDLLEKAIQKA